MMLFILACAFTSTLALEFTLNGPCPELKLQENFDFSKFSGTWYTMAVYASDGRATYNCAIMEINEDNMGYVLRESYIDIDSTSGDKVQKSYFARVDPTFDAADSAKFIVSHEDGDKVLQFPFVVLSTDYNNYAIAYTCQTRKRKPKMHYVYTWLLTREKQKTIGGALDMAREALLEYEELSAQNSSFVEKNFDEGCDSDQKTVVEMFTNNFW